MLLPISGIVKVYRGNLDVRVKSVLVEHEGTPSIMGHIETIRQELAIKVLYCLLWRDDVPFPRSVLLDGSFSASGSRVPVVGAEPLLFGQAIGNIGVKTVFRIG